MALAAAPLAGFSEEVDGVAATVGSEQILRSDVIAAMRRRGITDMARYDEVRNDLVDRTLILKAAGESKMTLQDWVVEDRVRTIVEEAFAGDRNKLVEAISREKLSYGEWRGRIKEDLIVNAMRWNEVFKNVRATPAKMRAEFAAHPERYRAEGKSTVSVILLDPEKVPLKDEVVAMIETNSFEAAAKKFSADSHASEGGLWKDIVPAEVFKKEVADELAKMEVGSVSTWIDLDGWSFLLRKDAESKEKILSFAEAYSKVEDNVREAEAKRLSAEWIDRLRSETYIRIY